MNDYREHGAGNISFMTREEEKQEHIRHMWMGVAVLLLAVIVGGIYAYMQSQTGV